MDSLPWRWKTPALFGAPQDPDLAGRDRRQAQCRKFVHLYGKFELDMGKRLDLGPDLTGQGPAPGPALEIAYPREGRAEYQHRARPPHA
ncbi:hypothetical protein [Nonomuraea endophytica]|uniref:hypothetical protein n=1 Tax=Nonomuraea endophytica TaxID=714136 RepID=UPI0037C94341